MLRFINERRLVAGRFSWQTGFGAFTYSKSQIQNVVSYIENQKQHGAKKTFREEYLQLLERFGIDYKHEYLFEWYD